MPPRTRPLRKTALDPGEVIGKETGTMDGEATGDGATRVFVATDVPSKMKIWMLRRMVVVLGALMEPLVALGALMVVFAVTDVPSKMRPLRKPDGTHGTVATTGVSLLVAPFGVSAVGIE